MPTTTTTIKSKWNEFKTADIGTQAAVVLTGIIVIKLIAGLLSD